MSETQKPVGKSCAGPLIAEMKHKQILDSKARDMPAQTLASARNRHQAFQFAMKPPLLELVLSSLTLETNSTVVWQSAGGISLILPDVQFGSLFQALSQMELFMEHHVDHITLYNGRVERQFMAV